MLLSDLSTRQLAVDGEHRLVLVDDTAAVDASSWNAVALAAGGSIFHCHEWHTAFAEAPPGRMRAAHVLAYRSDRLVGICPAYLVWQCPRLDYTLTLGRPSGLLLDGPILLAHSLAALAGGPLAIDGDPETLRALDRGMRAAAGQLGAVAWGYANLADDGFARWLFTQEYALAEVATDYRLPVGWDTPSSFWAALPRHRRQSLRSERYRAERLGLHAVLEPLPEVATADLIRKLLVARGTPADVLPPEFLAAMLRHLKPYERSIVARDEDGGVAAVFAAWQFGQAWSVWLAGLDTVRLATFAPYHAMVGTAIESAIVDRIALVDLGRANGAVKRRYGARSQPLLLALRSPDRGLNAALHLWCRTLQHHHAALNGLETTSRCC